MGTAYDYAGGRSWDRNECDLPEVPLNEPPASQVGAGASVSADDDIEEVRLCVGKIGRARHCAGARMRMVGTEHFEATSTRQAHGSEVIGRSNAIPRWARELVGGGDGGHDLAVASEQEAAALERSVLVSVRPQGIDDRVGYTNAIGRGHVVRSTTIAIPIPPPMQSEATP